MLMQDRESRQSKTDDEQPNAKTQSILRRGSFLQELANLLS